MTDLRLAAADAVNAADVLWHTAMRSAIGGNGFTAVRHARNVVDAADAAHAHIIRHTGGRL